MAKAAIPAGPVNTVAEVLEDPQIDAREMIKHLTHPEYGPIRVLGLPVKLSDTPGIVEGPPPIFGEHNRFVLAMLGYTENTIAGLEKDGTLVSRKEGI
jgi:crotonobetainyl-CoA:carnitine CoA-transferase CaiB-like acyl-CoA transferase